MKVYPRILVISDDNEGNSIQVINNSTSDRVLLFKIKRSDPKVVEFHPKRGFVEAGTTLEVDIKLSDDNISSARILVHLVSISSHTGAFENDWKTGMRKGGVKKVVDIRRNGASFCHGLSLGSDASIISILSQDPCTNVKLKKLDNQQILYKDLSPCTNLSDQGIYDESNGKPIMQYDVNTYTPYSDEKFTGQSIVDRNNESSFQEKIVTDIPLLIDIGYNSTLVGGGLEIGDDHDGEELGGDDHDGDHGDDYHSGDDDDDDGHDDDDDGDDHDDVNSSHSNSKKLEKNTPEKSQSFTVKSLKSIRTSELFNPLQFALKKSEKSMDTMVTSEIEKQSQDLQNYIDLFDDDADDIVLAQLEHLENIRKFEMKMKENDKIKNDVIISKCSYTRNFEVSEFCNVDSVNEHYVFKQGIYICINVFMYVYSFIYINIYI
jgi:hypothetical protein